ncbi:MAG: hypothetical protein K2L42_06285 [Clostridia bacterium]|nr:hypothetical protein [Clostridia bacterium]
MKNSVKRIIPVLALIVALCCGIAMMTACSADVVFTGDKEIMSIETSHTLTLKGDGTCTYDVTTDSEMQTAQQIVKSLCKTGTWEFNDDVYTVVLGEGATATTLKSTKKDSTYTIVYSIQGRDGTFDVTLTCKK